MRLSLERVRVDLGGALILDELNVDFRPGVIALIGENGAGKTTLLDTIAGLHRYQGHITLGDVDLAKLPPRVRAKRIRSLAQQNARRPGLGVCERIAHGLVPDRGPRARVDAATRDRISAVARELGVDHLLRRNLAQLSGGEQRRVDVGKCLVGQADVYLLDEPFAGVDIRHQLLVEDALRRRGEKSIVVVSVHDLGVAARLAHRILALRRGAIIADGDAGQVFEPAVLQKAFGRTGRLHQDATGTGVLLGRTSR